MNKIDIFVKYPLAAPTRRSIPNTLEALQRLVEGHIEVLRIATDIAVICNEEGKLLGLPYNCQIGRDVLVGTILFVGIDGEDLSDAPDWEMMSDFLPHIFEEDKNG